MNREEKKIISPEEAKDELLEQERTDEQADQVAGGHFILPRGNK